MSGSQIISCPLCHYQMDGDVIAHLESEHGVQIRHFAEGSSTYHCCCREFQTNDMVAFYVHFARHGRLCVLTDIMASDRR